MIFHPIVGSRPAPGNAKTVGRPSRDVKSATARHGDDSPAAREMNRRIKKKFDEVGSEIPFPHTSIYFGEASKPIQLQTQGPERDS